MAVGGYRQSARDKVHGVRLQPGGRLEKWKCQNWEIAPTEIGAGLTRICILCRNELFPIQEGAMNCATTNQRGHGNK